MTLQDDTHIVYRISEYADPGLQLAVTFMDGELNIPFPVENPVLSEQDKNAPFLKDSGCNYE